jgi:hypothetical protein
MFIYALARIHAADAFGEVRNLGFMAALYMKVANFFNDLGLGESSNDGEEEEDGSKSSDYNPIHLDAYILGISGKFGIELKGIPDLKDMIEGCEKSVSPLHFGVSHDPSDWINSFMSYCDNYGIPGMGFTKNTSSIGGDSLDITSWSSARRKKHSLMNKDPFGKKDLQALKEGMVMAAS